MQNWIADFVCVSCEPPTTGKPQSSRQTADRRVRGDGGSDANEKYINRKYADIHFAAKQNMYEFSTRFCWL